MNQANLFGALRGPVLLIALGVLFVIDQNGGFSFASTWPALIIVFGLFKLLESLAIKNPVGGAQ
ncbi:MAG: DUF5668 domain-containing protein [Bryobacteraceae bacterium]|nr:DUF5668 domain-containing protein [Bryobacteraceae bacterium]